MSDEIIADTSYGRINVAVSEPMDAAVVRLREINPDLAARLEHSVAAIRNNVPVVTFSDSKEANEAYFEM